MKRLVWVSLLLLPLAAVAGEIYRSVGENGVVVYSDRPSGDAERIVVATSEPSAAPTAPIGQAPAGDAEDSSSGSQTEGPVFAEVERELTPEERAANCEIARERAGTYTTARRLYRTGPDGEREYLSDAEIDEARATAESDVATWCD